MEQVRMFRSAQSGICLTRGAFFAWRALILSWPRIMCSQVRMLTFLEPSRENAVHKSVWRKKDCFLLPLNKHTMNIFIQISNSPRTRAQFSENQSMVFREPEHTRPPCSPRAPNLLSVLPSQMVWWNDLCSPGHQKVKNGQKRVQNHFFIKFY